MPLRILRALRLVKLLRILRSTRIMSRLQDQFYVHDSYVCLFKARAPLLLRGPRSGGAPPRCVETPSRWRPAQFGTSTVLLCHWMACIFSLVKDVSNLSCNWSNAYFNYDHGEKDPCVLFQANVQSVYLAALYWAAMSVSTVGYGLPRLLTAVGTSAPAGLRGTRSTGAAGMGT